MIKNDLKIDLLIKFEIVKSMNIVSNSIFDTNQCRFYLKINF